MFSLTPITNWMLASALPVEMTGQYLTTEPVILDVGTGKPSEWIEVPMRIVNRSDEPVTLIGAANDCKCSTVSELPIELPPFGSDVLRVSVRLGDVPGRETRRFWIRTTHQKQPILLCSWTAIVGN